MPQKKCFNDKLAWYIDSQCFKVISFQIAVTNKPLKLVTTGNTVSASLHML